MTIFEIFRLIGQEVARAERLHPDFPTRSRSFRYMVIAEELGEVAKALVQYEEDGKPLGEVRKELIQTAATCVRFLESLETEPETSVQ